MMRNRLFPHATVCRASGQALVELLVTAMFFLVPLFLAIAALGKFIDVQHTADMAARYGAWERTVWYESNGFTGINGRNEKSDAHIRAEVAARFLHDRSAAQIVRHNDRNATSLINGLNPMWQDAAARDYLDSYDDVQNTVTPEAPTRDVAGTILASLGSISVGGALSFVPPMPNNTLAVSTVRLDNVADTSGVYQRLWTAGATGAAWAGLDFTATGAVLSNTWATNGSGRTRDTVARMVPTAQAAAGAALGAAELGIRSWDPIAVQDLDIGKIAVDELPGDRLR